MNRVLAIDLGLKRTGFAISDPLGLVASPLSIIENETVLDVVDYIKNNILKTYPDINTIVIGVPDLNKKTKSNEQHFLFYKLLKEELIDFNIKIVLIDEFLSTKLALKDIINNVKSKKRRFLKSKKFIDKYAACIILETYLN